jgi:hypothetical protein
MPLLLRSVSWVRTRSRVVNKSSATNPNAITTTITFKTTGKPA